jgi:hypothetical protein
VNDLQPWDIITGDCVTELARLTGQKKRAVLAFADPPYNLGLDYGDTTDDRRPRPEFIQWCRHWVSECYLNLQRLRLVLALDQSRERCRKIASTSGRISSRVTPWESPKDGSWSSTATKF